MTPAPEPVPPLMIAGGLSRLDARPNPFRRWTLADKAGLEFTRAGTPGRRLNPGTLCSGTTGKGDGRQAGKPTDQARDTHGLAEPPYAPARFSGLFPGSAQIDGVRTIAVTRVVCWTWKPSFSGPCSSFSMRTWSANSSSFSKCGSIIQSSTASITDRDPLLGERSASRVTHESRGDFTIQQEPVRLHLPNLPKFVTVKGGGCFFLSGIRALRLLGAKS